MQNSPSLQLLWAFHDQGNKAVVAAVTGTSVLRDMDYNGSDMHMHNDVLCRKKKQILFWQFLWHNKYVSHLKPDKKKNNVRKKSHFCILTAVEKKITFLVTSAKNLIHATSAL